MDSWAGFEMLQVREYEISLRNSSGGTGQSRTLEGTMTVAKVKSCLEEVKTFWPRRVWRKYVTKCVAFRLLNVFIRRFISNDFIRLYLNLQWHRHPKSVTFKFVYIWICNDTGTQSPLHSNSFIFEFAMTQAPKVRYIQICLYLNLQWHRRPKSVVGHC